MGNCIACTAIWECLDPKEEKVAEQEVKMSNTKKYVLIGAGVIVLVIGLCGIFVPDARQFAGEVIRTVMGGVAGIGN